MIVENSISHGYMLEVKENDDGSWRFVISTFSHLALPSDGPELFSLEGKCKLLAGSIYRNTINRCYAHANWQPNRVFVFENREELRNLLLERARLVGYDDRSLIDAAGSAEERVAQILKRIDEEQNRQLTHALMGD